MTMVMMLGNRDQVIQVADRRLTAAGKIIDEQSCKSGTVFFGNGRFTFGFTGLAGPLGNEVQHWILDALYESAPPDYTAHKSLERFKERATKDFATLPSFLRADGVSRRLSIIFLGYLFTRDPPVLGCAVISNYQDFGRDVRSATAWDEFVSSYTSRTLADGMSFFECVGAVGAITRQDVSEIRHLLIERKPGRAIREKAFHALLKIADRPHARGTIGRQVTWIEVPSNPSKDVSSGSYSDAPWPSDFMPDTVFARPSARGVARDIKFGIVNPRDAPLLVPKVGRNAPCPCGSGKKYKKCHG